MCTNSMFLKWPQRTYGDSRKHSFTVNMTSRSKTTSNPSQVGAAGIAEIKHVRFIDNYIIKR